jgi:PAS domain S-box-containing protein
MADFGRRALAGMEMEELLAEASALVYRELDVDLVSVLKLLPDGRRLVLRAGQGWPPGEIGSLLVDLDENTLAAHTLRSREPVLAADVARDERFSASPRLRELGVVSAAAVTISGAEEPYGVLAGHSRDHHHFSADDLHLLQVVANSIGAAVQRERDEQRIRDSESHFRELADTTPALMWITDAAGRITFVNAAWRRFTGRTLEQALDEAVAAHPDDRDVVARQRGEAFAGRTELEAEYRLRRADGAYRWVHEVAVPRYAAGEFVGYMGTATDVHDRHAMEEGLRESEARFRELADAAPVMIWTTDAGGRVTFVNRSWLAFTGTLLEHEIGDSWALGVHPDDVDGLLASWGDRLSRGEPWEREYRLRRADGVYRWIVDRGVPRFEDGALAGYIGSATEIHERRTMEESLRRVYEREHRVAETLQRSLLPERLPEIEGLEVAARYLPAGRETAVGGDWYDAMELPDGRVALVVGDVAGHGLRAAATMGQLRTAARAYSQVESAPAEVVARLNRLVRNSGDDAMATVLYAVLDRDTGELAFTSAGHPPPLVLSPAGPRFLEGGRSVPVGAVDTAVFREGVERLTEGCVLLLYTDGLVERRDTPLEDRLAQLAAAADRAGSGLEALCEQLLSEVLGREERADDVAMLVVRALPIGSPRLELTLPAEPEALPTLRRRLVRFLHAAGASEAETYEVSLTVSEAAGNAIEHAYGPGDATFEVCLETAAGEIEAEVRDRGRWRDPRGAHRGRGLRIIEGLMDQVEVVAEEDGTLVRMRRRLAAP